MKEYKLSDELLEYLTTNYNRSKNQLQFLYNLLDGDFDKLLLLEEKIKEKHINYCPGCIKEINNILN